MFDTFLQYSLLKPGDETSTKRWANIKPHYFKINYSSFTFRKYSVATELPPQRNDRSAITMVFYIF